MKAALFSILALFAICAPACAKNTEIDEWPCPPGGTELTYDNFGKGFLDAHCQTCHGALVEERNGAPGGYSFGTHEEAKHFKARIFARAAADNVTMPPGPDDPPEDDRRKLADWLACGAN